MTILVFNNPRRTKDPTLRQICEFHGINYQTVDQLTVEKDVGVGERHTFFYFDKHENSCTLEIQLSEKAQNKIHNQRMKEYKKK